MADLAQELEQLHVSVVRTVRSRIESGEDTEQMKSKMAAKLNFSSLKEKVIPLRQLPDASLRHNSGEARQA